MCIYSVFQHLCGGQKLKIITPCTYAFTNYQNIQYCRLDPHAHVHDRSTTRVYSTPSYGPGICSNQNCRHLYGMVPLELSDRNDPADLLEDDAEFDMSTEACIERELRWYRLLTTDQQFEAIDMRFPVPHEAMSCYAKAYLHFAHLPVDEWAAYFEEALTADASPDEVTWAELNPRYMTQFALQIATKLSLLPAWVTDTSQPGPDGRKKSKNQPLTTTRQMPLYGPFKVGEHKCKPAHGFCKTCGYFHGKEDRGKSKKLHALDWAKGKENLHANDPATQGAINEFVLDGMTHSFPFPFHGNNVDRDMLDFFNGTLSEEKQKAYWEEEAETTDQEQIFDMQQEPDWEQFNRELDILEADREQELTDLTRRVAATEASETAPFDDPFKLGCDHVHIQDCGRTMCSVPQPREKCDLSFDDAGDGMELD